MMKLGFLWCQCRCREVLGSGWLLKVEPTKLELGLMLKCARNDCGLCFGSALDGDTADCMGWARGGARSHLFHFGHVEF